jgi:hypothetical protein
MRERRSELLDGWRTEVVNAVRRERGAHHGRRAGPGVGRAVGEAGNVVGEERAQVGDTASRSRPR